MSGKELKSAFKISGVYTGLILGAGFASGRELMNFFARFKNAAYPGIIVSGIIFALCGWAVLDICAVKKIDTYEAFSEMIFGRFAGAVIEYASALFLLVLFATMLAAGGAAFKEAFALPEIYGAAALAGLCLAVFVIGPEAFVRINAVLSPVMVAGGLLIGIYSVINQAIPASNISPEAFGGGSWFAQAIIYSCYNIVPAVSVLSTMRPFTASRKAAKYGGILGGLSLSVLGVALSVPLLLNYEKTFFLQIPMLYIADNYGGIIRTVYLLVLMSAIITTAVGNGYAFAVWFAGKIKININYANILAAVTALSMSGFGFSYFVAKIYPVFGAVGFVQLMFLLIYLAKSSKHETPA